MIVPLIRERTMPMLLSRARWHQAGSTPADADVRTGPGLPRILAAFLWLGLITCGGKGSPFLYDELVRRRRWLSDDDFAEAYACAKMLPGNTSVSTAAFLALRLRNQVRVALLCLIPYFVPGVLIVLGLTVLVFGQERPSWASGAIAGLSAGATALVLVTGLRLAPAARRARGGILLVALAFAASLYGVHLLVLLPPLLLLGVWLNRPAQPRPER
jgi:chromate transporter